MTSKRDRRGWMGDTTGAACVNEAGLDRWNGSVDSSDFSCDGDWWIEGGRATVVSAAGDAFATGDAART